MGIGFLEDQVQSAATFQGVVCRKLQAEPPQQKMAHLLEDQVEPAPPFTHCKVD